MARFGVSDGFVMRHRTTIASWLVVVLVAAGLAVYALREKGYAVQHADLDDGGIWVTNPALGLGRQNRPLMQLDGYVPAPAPDLDVAQNGQTVIAVDAGAATATPVSVDDDTEEKDAAVQFTTGGQLQLGGTTVAVDNPKTGAVWAAQVDPSTGQASLSGLDAKAKPLATVGPQAAMAVGTDGTVYAASRTGLATLHQAASAFAPPTVSSLSPAPTAAVAALTVVGEQPVYLDAAGRLGTATAATVPAGSRLQQPGDVADDVLVGEPDGLASVDLSSGAATQIASAKGLPSQPVRLQDCAYGAWIGAGTATVAVHCGSGTTTYGTLQGVVAAAGGTSPLVFRVNRGQLVINDIETGDVWPVGPGTLQKISNWTDVEPQKPSTKQDDQHQDTSSRQPRKPVAKPDDLGVRAGAETTLHVLDNDSAVSGAILAVTSVDTTTLPAGVQVSIAPDQQTLLATAPTSMGSRVVDFGYHIDDGLGDGGASSTVKLTVHADSDKGAAPPVPRKPAARDVVYPVAPGGTVDLPVIDDWRDPTYGDAITLDDASAKGQGTATVTAAGDLAYTAPVSAVPGVVTIGYHVSTQAGSESAGTARVKVLAKGASAAPQAMDDVVAGVKVGDDSPTITVSPLDNDVPGADGSDPNARLALVGDVHSIGKGGALPVTTDDATGTVSFSAARTGTFVYAYTVKYGDSQASTGHIRVIVTSGKQVPPIAVPDSVTIYGTQPRTVDVLANDYDPLGRVMVVQSATAVDDDGGLSVAVVDDHWLRIASTQQALQPATRQVHYSISVGDGASVTGTVSVTQRPSLGLDDTPTVVDDHVVVRAGDSVSVPVLDNDSVPSGAPIGLYVTSGGKLPVESDDTGDLGDAFYNGSQIRYVAPGDVSGPTTVQVPYTAVNQSTPADKASGVLWVTIEPKPRTAAEDQAPTPVVVEGRVSQGDTVVLKLPSTGLDPDGDSVSISGIGDPSSSDEADTVPTQGRILAYGANSITYQAFPTGSGTDQFSYVLTDTYGESAVGTVRVGVVPAGAPQQPVPVDDAATVDPSRTLTYDVVANDIKEPGTTATLAPLSGPAPGVSGDDRTGDVTVAPDRSRGDGSSLQVPYSLVGPVGETSPGTLSVRFKKGFDNPPTAGTLVAQPVGTAASVKVPVASAVSDIDDDVSKLTIDQFRGPGPTRGGPAPTVASNGSVTLPVGKTPSVWTYRVTDPEGAHAVGTVYVPATPNGAPYLRPGSEITMDPGSTLTVDIGKYVIDPFGRKVALTTRDTFAAVPDSLLSYGKSTATGIDLTSADRSGVGTLSFEVTDGSSPSDATAHTAVISIPVTVGKPAPVLSCPPDPIPVYDDAGSVHVDVAQVCHVWTADPAQAASLQFAAGSSTLSGLSAKASGDGLDITATGVPGMPQCTGGSRPGPSGTIPVTVAGGSGAAGSQLHIQVLCLPPPTFQAPRPYATTTSAGALQIDLTGNVVSRLPAANQHITVTAEHPIGGAPDVLRAQPGSARLTWGNPGRGHEGRYQYSVTLSDAAGDSGRSVTGVIEVDLADVPGAPRNLQWVARSPSDFLSHAVKLSWSPPADDGDDPNGIDHYVVSVDGHRGQQCAASPCQVTGVPTGKHTFTVYAANSVGDGTAASNEVPAWSGTIPGSVTGLTVASVGDDTVALVWAPPACQSQGSCARMSSYTVTSDHGTSQTTGTTSALVHLPVGTNGTPVTFTVSAHNPETDELEQHARVDVSNQQQVQGTPAGKPAAPTGLSATTKDPADPGNTKTLTLTWDPVDPNGPGGQAGVQYQTERDGTVICTWSANRYCDDSVPDNGSTHSYQVQARNQEAYRPQGTGESATSFTGPLSGKYAVEAAGTPDAVQITKLVPTGASGQATLSFTAGASHGKTSTVRCYYGSVGGASCGSWTGSTSGFSQTATIKGLTNGSSTTVVVVDDNGSKGGNLAGASVGAKDTQSVTAYGPIGTISLTATASERTISWSASVDANGKPVTVKVSDDAGHSWGPSTTGTGTQSYNGSFSEPDYSHTYHLTVTVTDTSNDGPTRATKTKDASASTGAAPPPVKTPKVAIARGDRHIASSCTDSTCGYVKITLTDFPAGSQVTCSATANPSYAPFSNHTVPIDGNGSYIGQPGWFYGDGGGTVTVTCGSASSSYTWPSSPS
jgi:hypothetical protein